jgi:hypothetical protein
MKNIDEEIITDFNQALWITQLSATIAIGILLKKMCDNQCVAIITISL